MVKHLAPSCARRRSQDSYPDLTFDLRTGTVSYVQQYKDGRYFTGPLKAGRSIAQHPRACSFRGRFIVGFPPPRGDGTPRALLKLDLYWESPSWGFMFHVMDSNPDGAVPPSKSFRSTKTPSVIRLFNGKFELVEESLAYSDSVQSKFWYTAGAQVIGLNSEMHVLTNQDAGYRLHSFDRRGRMLFQPQSYKQTKKISLLIGDEMLGFDDQNEDSFCMISPFLFHLRNQCRAEDRNKKRIVHLGLNRPVYEDPDMLGGGLCFVSMSWVKP